MMEWTTRCHDPQERLSAARMLGQRMLGQRMLGQRMLGQQSIGQQSMGCWQNRLPSCRTRKR